MNFNSHTREGVTARILSPLIYGLNFNSHTREGVTSKCSTAVDISEISTHTPVRV